MKQLDFQTIMEIFKNKIAVLHVDLNKLNAVDAMLGKSATEAKKKELLNGVSALQDTQHEITEAYARANGLLPSDKTSGHACEYCKKEIENGSTFVGTGTGSAHQTCYEQATSLADPPDICVYCRGIIPRGTTVQNVYDTERHENGLAHLDCYLGVRKKDSP